MIRSRDFEPDPEPSAAAVLPEIRLFEAMTMQAVRDLRHRDPLRALDALVWWLDEGPIWVNTLLNLDMSDQDIFKFAIGGAHERQYHQTK